MDFTTKMKEKRRGKSKSEEKVEVVARRNFDSRPDPDLDPVWRRKEDEMTTEPIWRPQGAQEASWWILGLIEAATSRYAVAGDGRRTIRSCAI